MTRPAIRTLRQHPILDFAYEELVSAADSTALVADQREYVIGTWSDCETFAMDSHLSADWPWNRTARDYDPDAYAFYQSNGFVFLAGRTERAVLYAIYDWAKEAWGAAWIYPGERTMLAEPGICFGIREPLFRRRGFVYETVYDKPYMVSVVDWLAKNRINELFMTFPLWDALKDALAPELEKRGIELTLGGHSMKFFLEGKDSERLPQDQPAFAGRKQVDYGDPSWQDALLAKIAAYCRSTPALTRVSLWPEDTGVKSDQRSFVPERLHPVHRKPSGTPKSGGDGHSSRAHRL